MLQLRWPRISLDLGQITLLAGLLILLAATIAFADLTVAKNAALAQKQAAQTKYDQAQTQRTLLQDDLNRAQRGDSIESDAQAQFNLYRRGVRIVLPAARPASSAAEGNQPVGPPYWGEWWKRLAEP